MNRFFLTFAVVLGMFNLFQAHPLTLTATVCAQEGRRPPGNRNQNREQSTAEKEKTSEEASEASQKKKKDDVFTIHMSDGKSVTGTMIRQINNRQWQLTTEKGDQMVLDRSKIKEILDVNGQSLQPSVRNNGDITLARQPEVTEAPTGRRGQAAPTTSAGVSVTMYNTWSAASKLATKSRRVRQQFLASGNSLEMVEVKLGGIYEVLIRVVDATSQQELGSQVVNNNAGTLQATFTPSLPLVIGQGYFVELERTGSPGNISAHITNDERFVFSQFQFQQNNDWKTLEGDAAQNDLVMRVRGRSTKKNTSQAPSQRAIFVLLENNGIISSLKEAKINYPDLPNVPYIVYTGSEGDIEFKLEKNESIAQALLRVKTDLDAFVVNHLGDAPKPPINSITNTPNPLDPGFVSASATYAQKLTTLSNKLLSPSNWKIRTESADHFIDVISDLVIEEFTKAKILQKTQGKYQHVEVMEDSNFQADKVLAKIKQLAPNYQLDIHVLSHGSVDIVVGHDTGGKEYLTRENFFIPVQQGRLNGQIPLHVRSVYQCNCLGGTLKREWQGIGAQAVNGTEGELPSNAKLNYMPQQYLHFLTYWCDQNKTFKQATDQSFDDARNYSEGVYSVLSEKPGMVNDSKLTISGNGNLKRN